MKTSRAALARLALLLAFGLAAVRSTCLGSACDEQHAAAKAHGLLGGTLLQDACPAKKYPSSGSLRAVRPSRASADPRAQDPQSASQLVLSAPPRRRVSKSNS